MQASTALCRYPFETQVGILGVALAAWAAAVGIYTSGSQRGVVRLLGRAALTLTVVLFPAVLDRAAVRVSLLAP